MSNLIVVGFKKDMYRASTVLNQLIGMDFDWVVDLRDAPLAATTAAGCASIRATG